MFFNPREKAEAVPNGMPQETRVDRDTAKSTVCGVGFRSNLRRCITSVKTDKEPFLAIVDQRSEFIMSVSRLSLTVLARSEPRLDEIGQGIDGSLCVISSCFN